MRKIYFVELVVESKGGCIWKKNNFSQDMSQNQRDTLYNYKEVNSSDDMYVPIYIQHQRANYVNQILLWWNSVKKGIIMMGVFGASLCTTDRSSRHKIKWETLDFNNTKEKMGLTDSYRRSHPKQKIFFHSQHATFTTIDHTLQNEC